MQVVVRVANLALGVFVTALVVRTLGQTGYGEWSTTFIVIGLISYFANFGMEGVALREAARDPEHEHEWIGGVMFMRLLMIPPVMICSVIALLLLARTEQMLIAGLVITVAMPFGGVSALGLLFRLRVNNRVPMMVLTLRSILWGIAVLIIFLHHGGMVALAIAMAVTNATGSVVQAVAALKLDARVPRPSRKRLREILKVGLPIGIAGVLVISYARIDQIIVFQIAGSAAAGLYGSVYTLLDSSHFVPISVLTTLSPVIAASWPADPGRLLRASRLTAELMAVTSLGALAFSIVCATPVVEAIFGPSFASAAPALPVLGTAFVLICFGYLNGNLLVVLGLQSRMMRISLVALLVNVIGNLALVPPLGFMGAAWMTLVTEIVVLVATSRLILQKLELALPAPGRIGRTVLASVLLGVALEALSLAGASLAVLVIAACLAYPALLFALRAVGMDDVRMVVGRRAPA